MKRSDPLQSSGNGIVYGFDDRSNPPNMPVVLMKGQPEVRHWR